MHGSMKPKILIDTNVLMDVLLGTRPSSPASCFVFDCIRAGQMEGLIVTQSIVDASYAIRKEGKEAEKAFRASVLSFYHYINEESVTSFDIEYACKRPSGDFEDDALYARAKDTACDAIVTNDIKFRKRYEGEDRHIRFFTPEELVRELTTAQTSAQ